MLLIILSIGCGHEHTKERPASVLNTVMEITKVGGGVGIPGLYVTEDPGGNIIYPPIPLTLLHTMHTKCNFLPLSLIYTLVFLSSIYRSTYLSEMDFVLYIHQLPMRMLRWVLFLFVWDWDGPKVYRKLLG